MGERLSSELQEYFSVKRPKKVPTQSDKPQSSEKIAYIAKLRRLDISPETKLIDIDRECLKVLGLTPLEITNIKRTLTSFEKVLIDRNLDMFYKVRVSDVRAMTDEQLRIIPVSPSSRGIQVLRALFGRAEEKSN